MQTVHDGAAGRVKCWAFALHLHTHTHTCLTALCPGLPGWAGSRKVKLIWILLKQESVSASGISWIYANLHLAPGTKSHQHPTAQFLLFLLSFSCFSKIQIGFTFLVPSHLGSPRKRAVKRVCVCVCVCVCVVYSVFCLASSWCIIFPWPDAIPGKQ